MYISFGRAKPQLPICNFSLVSASSVLSPWNADNDSPASHRQRLIQWTTNSAQPAHEVKLQAVVPIAFLSSPGRWPWGFGLPLSCATRARARLRSSKTRCSSVFAAALGISSGTLSDRRSYDTACLISPATFVCASNRF
jgi:hypothetical protein